MALLDTRIVGSCLRFYTLFISFACFTFITIYASTTSSIKLNQIGLYQFISIIIGYRHFFNVFCDPKRLIRLKRHVYKTTIGLVFLHDSEAWPSLKQHKQELHITEINKLRSNVDGSLEELPQLRS